MRHFKKTTCAAYETRELDREIAARGRRNAALTKGKQSATLKTTGERRKKELNLNTPKFHSLGHYAEAIRRFGTTDSYSTQIVRFHFLPKLAFHVLYRENLSING
jgi:hypothetical protein